LKILSNYIVIFVNFGATLGF